MRVRSQRTLLALVLVVIGALLLLWRTPSGGEATEEQVAGPNPLGASEEVETAGSEVSSAAVENGPGGSVRTVSGLDVEEAKLPEDSSAEKESTPAWRVRVVGPDGDPVPACSVDYFCGPNQYTHFRYETDGQGICSIPISPFAAREDAILIAGHVQSELTSDRVALSGVQEGGDLEVLLGPGVGLTVRVREGAGGLEVGGANIALSLVPGVKRGQRTENSDAEGVAHFTGLPAGELYWYVGAPASEHNLRGRYTLQRGVEHELEILLDAKGEPLALEGRFLDVNGDIRSLNSPISEEYDRPGLWVGSSIVDVQQVHPNSLGEFRVYRTPCEELAVFLNVKADGHRYAPERMTVPFGTRGLEFRVVEEHAKTTTSILVRDAQTLEPLTNAYVRVYLVDGMREGENLLVQATNKGLYRMQHRAWPGMRYVVTKKGYHHHFADLPADSGSRVVEVDMQPGIRNVVTVLDAETELPVTDAWVQTAWKEVVLARANDRGELVLADRATSEPLNIHAKGYRPCKWFAGWARDRVHLDRE